MIVELGCVRFIEQGKISAIIPQAMVTLFSLFYKLLISIGATFPIEKGNQQTTLVKFPHFLLHGIFTPLSISLKHVRHASELR